MSRDRIADIWGRRTPHPAGTTWPARVDQFLVDGVAEDEIERWVRGACLLCSNGCGAEVAVLDNTIVGIRGTATAAAAFGEAPYRLSSDPSSRSPR
ncbi:hypothetical protein FOE78_16395 [Microlunatus elymi]|uniref:4Fe-4S Mo/W bis-MGD-type domain-containing protein n=1 Tax=Microlunatus elymi TaxID=2596828 RepID=A0A516Q1I5_9ACTN|nr:hypothetical protein [Microlunatus elymi]QDP97293.1 hypothetical protein FOE78_16395 [Microlunatus elymi]